MKTKIKHITHIKTGLFAKPSDKGDVIYLQSKHFDENGNLQSALHPDLKSDSKTSKHILKYGDVLFAAKGTKNFAAVFETYNMAAVASTSFFVITITSQAVLPDYLMWFLNHPTTQSLLKSNARGTAIPSIRKSVLDELEMSIPSIEKQKLVIKLAKLANKETELRNQITAFEKQLIDQKILNEINYSI